MIRLIDLPGVAEIENRMTLNALTGVRQDHDLDRMVEGVVAAVFELKPECDPYDVDFCIEEDDAEDVIAAWRADGWDVARIDGCALECLDRFAWHLAAASDGLTLRTMIEIEAMAWGARSAVSPKVDPRDKARNQQFLNFGPRRRSAA